MLGNQDEEEDLQVLRDYGRYFVSFISFFFFSHVHAFIFAGIRLVNLSLN